VARDIVPSSPRPLVTSSPLNLVTSSPLHLVHLNYTLARPKFTDPDTWLKRVAFVSGVPEKLTAYGPQTVIYNIHYKGEVQRNGVRFLFPGFRRWQLVLPFAFNKMVKRLKPDVVLVHGLIFPWQIIMLRATLGKRVKIICQHHSERPFKDFRKYFSRWADQYTGAYLFASKTQGQEWVKAKQISSIDKVHEVIGMSSIFKPDLSKKQKGVYLWIGDLDENKDPLTAVAAFVKFAKKYPGTKLNMIFQNDHLLGKLKEIANESINFVGKVEHNLLGTYFNAATHIISTSHYEGIGIAVCEGLSCGCYPVLTNIPSFRMMTGNGRIGKLFEPGDEDALLDALQSSVYATGPEKIVDHFNSEFSFEAHARKIITIIESL